MDHQDASYSYEEATQNDGQYDPTQQQFDPSQTAQPEPVPQAPMPPALQQPPPPPQVASAAGYQLNVTYQNGGSGPNQNHHHHHQPANFPPQSPQAGGKHPSPAPAYNNNNSTSNFPHAAGYHNNSTANFPLAASYQNNPTANFPPAAAGYQNNPTANFPPAAGYQNNPIANFPPAAAGYQNNSTANFPPAAPGYQNNSTANFPPTVGYQNNSAANFPPAAGYQYNTANFPPAPGYPKIQSPMMIQPQLNVENWRTGLFDCMDDPMSAVVTAFCPCVTFGQVAEILDNGQTSCATSGMLYGLVWFFLGIPCVLSCTYRTKLRNKFALVESPAPDWVTHFLCDCCAICQEYRELQLRGLDPSIGWQGNVAKVQAGFMQQQANMNAPPNQRMMS